MNKIIKNPRKGVTLVELVIALSVIAIISVAAISMLHTAVKIEVRAASIIEANNTAESIVEIFRFTDYDDEFESLTKSLDNSFGSIDWDNEKENENSYIIDRGSYHIEITYYYIEETVKENDLDVKKNRGYKIEIEAFHKDGAPIYNEIITFIKGQ